MKPALEATPEERERQYEEAWQRGGLPFLGAYGDLLFEKAANDTIAEFARDKIRGIVKDPATAELLCPHNVFGCKRLCVDTGYFETYNLPHVKLVDVSKTPIERFTAERHRSERHRVSARRHRLRDRLCRDDGIVRQDPRSPAATAGRWRRNGGPAPAPISAWRRRAFPICSRSPGRAARRCWRA